MEMNESSIVRVGAKAIAGTVGVSWKNLKHYIDEKGLPAFRVDGAGPWVALVEDLETWIREQRDEQLRTRNGG